MEIQEIMVDFFEGEASSDYEQIMFREMSKDTNLIETFKNHMAIDKAVSASINTFTATPAMTNAIFSKLGYSIPATMQVRQFPFNILRNKFFSHVFVSFASVILTIAVIFSFFYPFQNNKSMAAAGNNYQLKNKLNKQIPLSESKEITSNGVNNRVQNEKLSFNKIINNVTNESREDLGQSNDKIITQAAISAMTENQFLNSNNNDLIFRNKFISIDKPYSINYRGPEGLSISIRNTPSWSLNKKAFEPNSVSSFNNLCFSLNYDLSKYIRIGGEIRQENFYTEYTGTENSDTLYLYKQENNLTTYSAMASFYPYDLGPFYTLLGINLGFNSGGFIVRPFTGIEYNAYRDLAFTLGLEYSYYRYFHDKNWFGASKVGINYGVIIKF